VRNKGWQGSPPANDDEARERIIGAAMRCIDRHGPAKTGLSDVAAELGVTRQTVYRLYPSTQDLFSAVAVASTDTFLDRLVARFGHIADPAEMLIEMMAYTLERMPKERYLGMLLDSGPEPSYSRDVTSPIAFQFARSMLKRLDVDWERLGYGDAELDEMVEFLLRVLQSFALDPGPARTRVQRRAFLRRWVGPAITQGMLTAPVEQAADHSRQ
jgi:AcrR family transcriptional regulator